VDFANGLPSPDLLGRSTLEHSWIRPYRPPPLKIPGYAYGSNANICQPLADSCPYVTTMLHRRHYALRSGIFVVHGLRWRRTGAAMFAVAAICRSPHGVKGRWSKVCETFSTVIHRRHLARLRPNLRRKLGPEPEPTPVVDILASAFDSPVLPSVDLMFALLQSVPAALCARSLASHFRPFFY